MSESSDNPSPGPVRANTYTPDPRDMDECAEMTDTPFYKWLEGRESLPSPYVAAVRDYIRPSIYIGGDALTILKHIYQCFEYHHRRV